MSETSMSQAAAAGAFVPPAAGEFPLPLRSLLDAGVHFGHQTKRWNPKMRPFIYGARNGIHIVDLDQTVRLFKKAYDFVVDAVARGGSILFVGTKRQAQDIVQEEARRSGMYFVTNRWLGGTLTNFRTIKQGLDRLRTLERMKEDGTYEQLLKKEVSRLEKERERLEKYLGGLKGMAAVPAAIFVIDPHQEAIGVNEARKLGVQVIGITDTNCDPDQIDFVIPGNDDAIRSIRLITARIADAALEGMQRRKDSEREQERERPNAGAAQGGGGGGGGGRRDEISVYQGGRRGGGRRGGGGGQGGGGGGSSE